VDGDSASSTELYGLLSALSEIPLRQDIAVTGSVNQKGEVQAIGGVNQKVEGFYDVCKIEGLTGNQGVMVPASNVNDMMLRKDVVQAVADGKFHIYAIDNIKDGIEILTGVAAGERGEEGKYPEDSVFGKAEARLDEMARSVRDFGKKKDEDGEEGEEGEKSEEEKQDGCCK
jgi:Lon-like ATP-dependent protease